MSQRLADRFAACRQAKRTAFVGFVTAGYPRLQDTVPALLEMQKNGADVIELGVPFSDPMADGSVIEAASVVALKNGVQYDDVLAYCKEARAKGLTVPVLMMGYYNSFLAAGVEETCKAAKAAGVDGFIIVDLPTEEGWRVMAPAAAANELSLVPLASPTSGAERIAQAAEGALSPIPGMVYVVSLLGTTGARDQEAAESKRARLVECKGVVESLRDAAEKLGAKREDLPIVVGFGITSRAHVLEFGEFADGCVVGSKIVKEISTGGVAAVGACVRELSGGPLQATIPSGKYKKVTKSDKVNAPRQRRSKSEPGRRQCRDRGVPSTRVDAEATKIARSRSARTRGASAAPLLGAADASAARAHRPARAASCSHSPALPAPSRAHEHSRAPSVAPPPA